LTAVDSSECRPESAASASVEQWNARIVEVESNLELLNGGVDTELDTFEDAKSALLSTVLTAHARNTIAACERRNELLQGLLQQFSEEPKELESDE